MIAPNISMPVEWVLVTDEGELLQMCEQAIEVFNMTLQNNGLYIANVMISLGGVNGRLEYTDNMYNFKKM